MHLLAHDQHLARRPYADFDLVAADLEYFHFDIVADGHDLAGTPTDH
jgi:hypothetical protein